MKIFALLLPILFLFTFLFAVVKKVPVYDSFTKGAKKALPLLCSLFPYLFAVILLSKIMQASGLEDKLVDLLSPLFERVGVPKELTSLVLIKPLSGSGATAVLTQIVETYGVDCYISRAACVLYGSTETVFYIGAVYFSQSKKKNLTGALCIATLVYILSVLFACLICRFL